MSRNRARRAAAEGSSRRSRRSRFRFPRGSRTASGSATAARATPGNPERRAATCTRRSAWSRTRCLSGTVGTSCARRRSVSRRRRWGQTWRCRRSTARTGFRSRGTQSGDLFRLAGKGLPDVHGYGRGDILVQVVVEVPKRLSRRQEELLRELAATEEKGVLPHRESFLEKLAKYLRQGNHRGKKGGKKPKH